MTPSDIRRYVDATGDRNPLWFDDDYARSRGLPRPHSAADFSRLGAVQHQGKSRRLERGAIPDLRPPDSRAGRTTPTCATRAPKPNGCNPSIRASSFRRRVASSTSSRARARAGLGIYITQEEQILNSAAKIVMRRRHTMALFPESSLGAQKANKWLASSNSPTLRRLCVRALLSKQATK